MSETVRLEWLGVRLPKHVELPVGYTSRSEVTGRVECNRIGEFPLDDAVRLLALDPDGELWRAPDGIPGLNSVAIAAETEARATEGAGDPEAEGYATPRVYATKGVASMICKRLFPGGRVAQNKTSGMWEILLSSPPAVLAEPERVE